MLALCHPQVDAQRLTNGIPSVPQGLTGSQSGLPANAQEELPDDPAQELLPEAMAEPQNAAGTPIQWEALHQSKSGDTWTLEGDVTVHYRDYIIRADKVVYHQTHDLLEAEGHLQAAGGSYDLTLEAERAEVHPNQRTARFVNVRGTMGVRQGLRAEVYTTTNPMRFRARVLLELGDGSYKMVEGAVTNCRLPKPDWEMVAGAITVKDGKAKARNTRFEFLGIPIFELPYLEHPASEEGRQSGLLVPVISTGSSVRGNTFGEQAYIVLGRSMDMVVGTEYFSKRGWAPNGDFRYRGPGLDHALVRWNALIDRGYDIKDPDDASKTIRVNQGGVDILAQGRLDLTSNTRIAADIEYLSRYAYRLEFNDNYWQAVSSEVQSEISATTHHGAFIPSIHWSRFQSYASSDEGNQVRILHLPSLRYDLLDQPLGRSPFVFGMGSSLDFLNRAEPDFHARNLGRLDIYPHLALPLSGGGWNVLIAGGTRNTFYSTSQTPDLDNANNGIPKIRHELIERANVEASADVRPPAMERDFVVGHGNTVLRHVIEPEISYRYVSGIGNSPRNIILVDTTDIATDTNEIAYSLTQRLYRRTLHPTPCDPAATKCSNQPREWASWQIAQKVYLEPHFGGALIRNQRNVFDTTLDLSGVAFLTSSRNLSPVVSRMRFEAVRNLRLEWDMDYDPKAGRLNASNVYAGYSFGKTTAGVGHSVLKTLDATKGVATVTHNQQIEPFIEYGKSTSEGFNIAANGSYDFVNTTVQYAGVQAVYNWNCCGLTVGYRRFTLGSDTATSTNRDETQYLYSFTLANFGSVGDIRRANRIFRDPNAVPNY